MEISVVVPVYNEEKNIYRSLLRLKDFLSKNFQSFEIIAVNDGSTDKTIEILKSISFVRLISYAENKGKGYAVKRGIFLAKGDYIFFTDADLSYPPENFVRAVKLLKSENSEYVIGIREDRKRDYPFFRRLASKMFSKAVELVLKLDAEDTQCGFKGFKKNIAKNIFPLLSVYRFGFDFELLYFAEKLKLKKSGLPVRFLHSNESHIRLFKDSADMLMSLLKIKCRSIMLEKNKL